jgi:hypothetical protein
MAARDPGSELPPTRSRRRASRKAMAAMLAEYETAEAVRRESGKRELYGLVDCPCAFHRGEDKQHAR